MMGTNMWRFLLDDLRERPGCVLETKAQLSVFVLSKLSRIPKKLASAPAQYISFRMFLQTKVWAQKLLGITRLTMKPQQTTVSYTIPIFKCKMIRKFDCNKLQRDRERRS